jgi:hypothetical protein
MTSLVPEAITALPGSAASAVVWRHRGQLQVTVIAKATFAFVPDAEMLSVEPERMVRVEVHHGKNPARSVRLTSDLAPYLARAEVLFTGHACAPPGAPAQALPVRLGVFDGERARLDKTLTVQDPAGFQSLPMTYERAFGGLGFLENPFGTGADAGSPAPNILDPREPRRPAGFAPFGRAFPARKRLLGATSRADLDREIAEIPDDFDWGYYQAAPPDQRVDALSGGEWIVLEGLHSTLPRLRTRLPGARGLARVYGLGRFGVADGQMLELVADTLRIDGDAKRCTVVWRRSFPVRALEALAGLRIVAGVEVGGAALRWPGGVALAVAAPVAAPAEVVFRGTLAPGPDEEGEVAAPPAALPFQGAFSALAQARPRRDVPRDPVFSGTFALDPEEEERVVAQGMLPFGEKPAEKALPVAPAPVVIEEVPVAKPVKSGSPWAPPPPPVASEPAPATPAASASPWAPSPPPPPPVAPAPRPARVAITVPIPPSLKGGLYERFNR